MCFSPEMSGTFFLAGALATAYLYVHRKDYRPYTYVLVGFYTLMELLQTIQYFYVNQCGSNVNVFFTNVAYVFVLVQPFLWNLLYFLRSKNCEERGIFRVAIALCCVWMAWSVTLRLAYKKERDNKYAICNALTDTKTCTMREEGKHLYWKWTSAYVPGISAEYFMFMALWFVPALITKTERQTAIGLAFTAIFSIAFIHWYGGRLDEFASTWCLTSVPFALCAFIFGINMK